MTHDLICHLSFLSPVSLDHIAGACIPETVQAGSHKFRLLGDTIPTHVGGFSEGSSHLYSHQFDSILKLSIVKSVDAANIRPEHRFYEPNMLNTTVVNIISYFYPIGNTPGIRLAQGLPLVEDVDILLLGCGDARNILFTTFCDVTSSMSIIRGSIEHLSDMLKTVADSKSPAVT